MAARAQLVQPNHLILTILSGQDHHLHRRRPRIPAYSSRHPIPRNTGIARSRSNRSARQRARQVQRIPSILCFEGQEAMYLKCVGGNRNQPRLVIGDDDPLAHNEQLRRPLRSDSIPYQRPPGSQQKLLPAERMEKQLGSVADHNPNQQYRLFQTAQPIHVVPPRAACPSASGRTTTL